MRTIGVSPARVLSAVASSGGTADIATPMGGELGVHAGHELRFELAYEHRPDHRQPHDEQQDRDGQQPRAQREPAQPGDHGFGRRRT
ncbi:hypothetical protein [Nonomuraea salmonea]|uniref:hypothetical protein n=1 Tax=Nonomuraea salmonea TaxID=46181 RepID=UPI002FE9F3EF